MAEIKEVTTLTENDKPIIDYADLVVKFSKISGIKPPLRRYARINVLGTKANGGDLKGERVSISNLSTHASKIKEKEELILFEDTEISLWNPAEVTAAHLAEMKGFGSTLVVLSEATTTFKEKIEALNIMGLSDFYIWFTESAATTTLKKFTSASNMGVMIDVEKKGHLLYALTRFLHNPRFFSPTQQIENPSFKGIILESESKQLDDAGYSYFFRCNDRVFLHGFWMGGLQARTLYADLSIRYDVKSTVASTLVKGMSYTSTTLGVLETRIAGVIRDNPFVVDLLRVSIPPQPDSNIVKGLIDGVLVKYKSQNEVRTIKIIMESVI